MDVSFIIYMLSLGLATSLHCVSMCGPLVLTYAVKGEEDGPWYKKLTPNVAYQGAKVVSYMLVGLLLGAVGSFFNLEAIRPYVMYLAGAFMIVLGLGMTGRVPWAARLTPRPPKWLMSLLVKLRRKSSADAEAGTTSLATPVTFGLMTGLLPCGPLMAAQVAAAASGSALTGSLGMAAFAVGTAPLMLAFGTAGSLIPRVWKDRLMTVLAVGVIIFGFVFIDRGLMLTGAPVNFNTVKTAFIGGGPAGDASQYTTAEDGVVEVPLVIENVKYVPQTLQIPENKPVRLIVDRREAHACSDELWLPQLGIQQKLNPNGTTVIDIPPTKGGSYSMTCQMGMMSGQLNVGGGAAQGGSPIAWLVLATGAAGGALYYVRRREQATAQAPASKGGQKTGGPKGQKSPAPAPSAGGLFGLDPTETLLAGVAILVAIFAGLALGGFFA